MARQIFHKIDVITAPFGETPVSWYIHSCQGRENTHEWFRSTLLVSCERLGSIQTPQVVIIKKKSSYRLRVVFKILMTPGGFFHLTILWNDGWVCVSPIIESLIKVCSICRKRPLRTSSHTSIEHTLQAHYVIYDFLEVMAVQNHLQSKFDDFHVIYLTSYKMYTEIS